MEIVSEKIIQQLYQPPPDSHKGQNGKLVIIGGSRLFHGASLWALKTASRIVDMVFYSPAEGSEQLTERLKSQLYDFISVARHQVGDYIEEADAVLIGPGLVRGTAKETGTGETGAETKRITRDLLRKFPQKKWVFDAGSLQVMEADWLKRLDQVIITPHQQEFRTLFKFPSSSKITSDQVNQKAKEYRCIILFKGPEDIICSPEKCFLNQKGNSGMTKGGTGDVLAGLTAGLVCKNDPLLAAAAAAYINGLAGDQLFKQLGPYFNASDLCEQIPKTMAGLIRGKWSKKN